MSEVSVSLLKSVLYGAEKMGVNPNELIEKGNIDRSILEDIDTRIDCELLSRTVNLAAEITGNPDYGLEHGEFFQPTALNIVGYICMNAPTVRVAYRGLMDYEGIIGNSLKNKFTEGEYSGFVEMEFSEDAEQYFNRQLCEKLLSEHITALRQFVGQEKNPKAVYFMHSEPESVKTHERVFKCPVYFDQPKCMLEFSNEFLDEKVINANPHLYTLFQKNAQDILNQIEQNQPLSKNVGQEILNILHGEEPTIEKVASCLNLSVRTLQRKLKDEGTSYQNILDSVRKEVAVKHLKEKSLSISDISYLLGFSEPSVFHRNFKKWVGKTPKMYRNEYLIMG